jgi:hypothetical protein
MRNLEIKTVLIKRETEGLVLPLPSKNLLQTDALTFHGPAAGTGRGKGNLHGSQYNQMDI